MLVRPRRCVENEKRQRLQVEVQLQDALTELAELRTTSISQASQGGLESRSCAAQGFKVLRLRAFRGLGFLGSQHYIITISPAGVGPLHSVAVSLDTPPHMSMHLSHLQRLVHPRASCLPDRPTPHLGPLPA